MVCLLAHSLPDAQRRALADACVDDDAVDTAKLVFQFGEHLRHLVVVVDVERRDGHGDAGVPLGQLGPELVEPVQASRAQREVAALGGECPGHTRAEAGAGARDQDLLASHPDSVSMMER